MAFAFGLKGLMNVSDGDGSPVGARNNTWNIRQCVAFST